MKEKTIKNQNGTALVCEICWSAKKSKDWDALFTSARRSSLLQSPPYVRAMAKLNNQTCRYGVIKIGGVPAGLCTILEAGVLRNAIHAVILDQGPVWFDGFGSVADFEKFMGVLRADFPKRFGRRMRLIPLMKNTDTTRSILNENGFNPISDPYHTIWIDCTQTLADLRSQLKKKWRNALTKAEKSDVDVVWSAGGENLGWLVEHYIEDRALKNYPGPSLKTLMALISEFSRGQNLMIGTAVLDGKPIASILIFIHASSATYQIGYSGKVGREKSAHHLILWDALERLKERRVYDFDLGGINEGDAKGVRNFKIGMGGEVVETPGLWT